MFASRALLLVLPLTLATTGSAQSILLRFKPPVGLRASYTMSTSMQQSLPGMPAGMNSKTVVPMTMRVVSRKGNHTTMETKTGTAKVTMGTNSPMASMKTMMEQMISNKTVTSVSDEFGNQKSTTEAGGGGMMGGGVSQNNQSVTFPAGPIKVGASWNTTLDMEKIMGSMAKSGMTATGKIPIVYRLASIKKVGSRTLATIAMTMKGSSTMTMPQGKMNMNINATGQTVIDAGTGMVISNSMTSDTTMAVMGQNMKQHMTMSMK